MKIQTIIAATCAALAFSMAGPVYAHDSEAETVTKNFEAAIPNIPGKSLLAVEVDYAPGAASPSHTHAKSAFIYAYVISGAIESKVNDGETRIYRAGESWSEPPGAIHSISRNASKTEPAKLLAVFVLDTNDNTADHAHQTDLQQTIGGTGVLEEVAMGKNILRETMRSLAGATLQMTYSELTAILTGRDELVSVSTGHPA